MYVHELDTSICWGDCRDVQYVCRSSDWTSAELEWWYMYANELSDRSANSDPDGVSDDSILSMGTICSSRIHRHGYYTSDSGWLNIYRGLSELLCQCEGRCIQLQCEHWILYSELRR